MTIQRPLKRSDQVTRVLAGRIVNGDLGLPPAEQDMCEEFSVSKSSTREMIRALAPAGSSPCTTGAG